MKDAEDAARMENEIIDKTIYRLNQDLEKIKDNMPENSSTEENAKFVARLRERKRAIMYSEAKAQDEYKILRKERLEKINDWQKRGYKFEESGAYYDKLLADYCDKFEKRRKEDLKSIDEQIEVLNDNTANTNTKVNTMLAFKRDNIHKEINSYSSKKTDNTNATYQKILAEWNRRMGEIDKMLENESNSIETYKKNKNDEIRDLQIKIEQRDLEINKNLGIKVEQNKSEVIKLQNELSETEEMLRKRYRDDFNLILEEEINDKEHKKKILMAEIEKINDYKKKGITDVSELKRDIEKAENALECCDNNLKICELEKADIQSSLLYKISKRNYLGRTLDIISENCGLPIEKMLTLESEIKENSKALMSNAYKVAGYGSLFSCQWNAGINPIKQKLILGDTIGNFLQTIVDDIHDEIATVVENDGNKYSARKALKVITKEDCQQQHSCSITNIDFQTQIKDLAETDNIKMVGTLKNLDLKSFKTICCSYQFDEIFNDGKGTTHQLECEKKKAIEKEAVKNLEVTDGDPPDVTDLD